MRGKAILFCAVLAAAPASAWQCEYEVVNFKAETSNGFPMGPCDRATEDQCVLACNNAKAPNELLRGVTCIETWLWGTGEPNTAPGYDCTCHVVELITTPTPPPPPPPIEI